MELILGMLQVVGIFILLPAFVGFTIVAFFQPWKHKARIEKSIAELACSVDADCPPGYVCVSGRCVPAVEA